MEGQESIVRKKLKFIIAGGNVKSILITLYYAFPSFLLFFCYMLNAGILDSLLLANAHFTQYLLLVKTDHLPHGFSYHLVCIFNNSSFSFTIPKSKILSQYFSSSPSLVNSYYNFLPQSLIQLLKPVSS